MTNYNDWDKKAKELVQKADEDDEQLKAEADKALGLEGGPQGPPTAKAEGELKELGEHSDQRKDFIKYSKDREISVTHTPQEEPVELIGEEMDGRAVRISGSEGVTYKIPQGSTVVKLIVDQCRRVRIEVEITLLTSSVELYKCDELDLDLRQPIGTIQVDECSAPTRVHFAERDHVGKFYHQNSPGLSVTWGDDVHVIGKAVDAQFSTGLSAANAADPLTTIPVQRGEGDFPVDLGEPISVASAPKEPEAELPPNAEDMARLAEEFRLKANDMFRANDFMQAAMIYTQAIELDGSISTLWANRAQCWLKLGDHEKALTDATRSTEVDPANAKGWFRKGMSLHGMERYPEAVPALLEAEKLDPANKQIPDAIRMAQMKARMEAAKR